MPKPLCLQIGIFLPHTRKGTTRVPKVKTMTPNKAPSAPLTPLGTRLGSSTRPTRIAWTPEGREVEEGSPSSSCATRRRGTRNGPHDDPIGRESVLGRDEAVPLGRDARPEGEEPSHHRPRSEEFGRSVPSRGRGDRTPFARVAVPRLG